MSAATERSHLTTIIIMNNLWKAFPHQATLSGTMSMLGLLKSGKLILRCANDRGDPMKLLRERDLVSRDRSGRPDIDSQEEAWPQQFVIGNDEAELELSVESRSFVNRMNDQVRKRQKRISNVTEKWRETFHDLGNAYGCDNGIASIHGKEFPEQLSLHCEHDRSHTETDVQHIYEIGVRTR